MFLYSTEIEIGKSNLKFENRISIKIKIKIQV